MDDQVGIAADGRSEVGIAGSGKGEVALVDLGVARLPQRAQHEVAEDALFGRAFDFSSEFLIHARRDGNVFGGFVPAWVAAAALGFATIAARDNAFDGKSAEAERVAEGRG